MIHIKKSFQIPDHILVAKHSKVSEKEKNEILDQYRITLNELPRIALKDAAIDHLDLKADDVVKIERPSPTSDETVFYRRVI